MRNKLILGIVLGLFVVGSFASAGLISDAIDSIGNIFGIDKNTRPVAIEIDQKAELEEKGYDEFMVSDLICNDVECSFRIYREDAIDKTISFPICHYETIKHNIKEFEITKVCMTDEEQISYRDNLLSEELQNLNNNIATYNNLQEVKTIDNAKRISI